MGDDINLGGSGNVGNVYFPRVNRLFIFGWILPDYIVVASIKKHFDNIMGSNRGALWESPPFDSPIAVPGPAPPGPARREDSLS